VRNAIDEDVVDRGRVDARDVDARVLRDDARVLAGDLGDERVGERSLAPAEDPYSLR
jgi:hypothetical protein